MLNRHFTHVLTPDRSRMTGVGCAARFGQSRNCVLLFGQSGFCFSECRDVAAPVGLYEQTSDRLLGR